MINKLSDTHIRKAAWPDTKSLSDGKGLRVILTAKSKVFQFRYQRPVNKKINNLVIGHYPSMTLKKAREVAQRYRDFLLDGVDPQYGKISKSVDFDALAKNYFKVQKSKWTNGHYKTQKGRYEKYIKAGVYTLHTSLVVAEAFGKRHDNILRVIETLECSGEFRALNFEEAPYTHPQNKQTYIAYNITKDGFMFLVMGFTGKKAAAWKEAFINAFNQMAEQLNISELE